MYKLYNGDCLEVMDKLIADNIKVDAIITDPPYNTTANSWDLIIPFDRMWERLNKLVIDDGIICLFGNQPFTSQLICSNLKDYRYSWIWDKESANGFLNCNYAPLKVFEDICIFSKGTLGSKSKLPIRYNPQGIVPINRMKRNNPNSSYRQSQGYTSKGNLLNSDREYVQKFENYPTNILRYKRDSSHYHPTQKPIELLQYLVRTYTQENETVLDFTMGSGSTGVACVNTNRNFIGIELEKKYYDIAKDRIEKADSSIFDL